MKSTRASAVPSHLEMVETKDTESIFSGTQGVSDKTANIRVFWEAKFLMIQIHKLYDEIYVEIYAVTF